MKCQANDKINNLQVTKEKRNSWMSVVFGSKADAPEWSSLEWPNTFGLFLFKFHSQKALKNDSEQLGPSLHTLLPSFILLAEKVRLKNYLFSFVSSFYALDVCSVTKLTCILNKHRKKPLNNTYLRSMVHFFSTQI